MNQQPLHVAYTLKNQKAFRQLLDRDRASVQSANNANSNAAVTGASLTGSSGPRSWTLHSVLGAGLTSSASTLSIDVNAKDHLGRTVLHRVCSSLEPAAGDYLRMLLNHPTINVNAQDLESRWTPLHRALYAGNIVAAVLLLQRSDTDTLLKDYEGHSAFDVYNSTVENTRPSKDAGAFDLFTWGANRNAALGHGDANDRAYPELVNVPRGKGDDRRTGSAKFYPLQVRGVSMSKLHTALITAESRGNLRLCGFGSGGRLGGTQNTQYTLTPLAHFDAPLLSVACGQDHTLVLTTSNEILSWGLNRFAQLGYILENVNPTQRSEEPIQSSPRKIVGLLKGKKVLGIAACRMASAAWTSTGVYTWGTNSGQLGYQEQVQVLPRAVPVLVNAIDVALTDTAMACLLETKDVMCFAHNSHFKISFPANAWPSAVKPYRPPQSGPPIVKIASCDSTFVALSELGDVFTFSTPTEAAGSAGRPKLTLKPQRVWALRKQMSAVVDVAPGADGSLILCTESGHVFVRQRVSKPSIADLRHRVQASSQPNTNASNLSQKTFKFQRIPFLQRVVKVSTNSTGAYAALRVDAKPAAIPVVGNTLAEDMTSVRPFVVHHTQRSLAVDDAPDMSSLEDRLAALSLASRKRGDDEAQDDDDEEAPVDHSLKVFSQLLGVLTTSQHHRLKLDGEALARAHGADVVLRCGIDIPVHRVVLEARSSAFTRVLGGKTLSAGRLRIAAVPPTPDHAGAYVDISGCHALAVLSVVQYLYSDELAVFWDRRIGSVVAEHVAQQGTSVPTLKAEVEALARLLGLDALEPVLSSSSQRSPPSTIPHDLFNLFSKAQSELRSSPSATGPRLGYDVVLELADRQVACHSAVLRARSPLFASFLDDPEWTARRWEHGVLRVNVKHLNWLPMSYIFKFIYGGDEASMFDSIDFADNLDDYLDFLFSVLGCATELLLDRLILVCSTVIIRHVNMMNVCALLADASYFNAAELVDRLQVYMAMNLESLLESRILEDMEIDLIAQLAKAIRVEQAKKLSVSRSGLLVNQALEKHADWLNLQDFPQPIVRSSKSILAPRHSPRLSPTAIKTPSKSPRPLPQPSPPTRPEQAKDVGPSGDDIFDMEDDSIPPLSLGSPRVGGGLASTSAREDAAKSSGNVPWKAKSVPAQRVDLKAIMAETAGSNRPPLSLGKGKDRVIGFEPAPAASPSTPTRDNRRPWGSKEASPSPSTSGAGVPLAPPGSSSLSRPAASASSGPSGFPTLGSLSASRPAPPTSPTSNLRVGPPLNRPSEGPAATPSPNRTSSGRQLGPTITPMRITPADSPTSKRRTADAWSAPAFEVPPPRPTSQTAAGGSTSFADIQQQQRDANTVKDKPKKSLLEIQQEEADVQAEVDFMTWWTMEEERLRLEQVAAAANGPNGGGKHRPGQGGRGGAKKPSHPRRKPQATASATGNDSDGPGKQSAPNPRRPSAQSNRASGPAPSQSQPRPKPTPSSVQS